jgi:hypothetical protein
MNAPDPECPACRVKMQEGYVLDAGHGGTLQRIRWIDGRPEKGMMGGQKVKGKRQMDTVTFRCPKCGWLIWFAPELAESDE